MRKNTDTFKDLFICLYLFFLLMLFLSLEHNSAVMLIFLSQKKLNECR